MNINNELKEKLSTNDFRTIERKGIVQYCGKKDNLSKEDKAYIINFYLNNYFFNRNS